MNRSAMGAGPNDCQAWDIGTGVAGYAWHAEDARAALLLQHGLGEYAERYVTQYNGLIPRLLAARISVYAIDMWGHGRSPGRRKVTDMRRAVEDHLAARRKLRSQPLPVFVMGHSLGGLVTAGSVVRDQRGLSGAIISSPVLYLDCAPLKRYLLAALSAVVPMLRVKSIDSGGITRIAEISEAAQRDPMMCHARIPALLAASALAVCRDNRDLYGDWQVPTLLLHGTADTVTSPEGSAMFYEAIGSKDKTLHLVQGGYHELLNDIDRDDTLQTILAWLQRRLPADEGQQ